MRCNNCGAELLPDVRICLECGCDVPQSPKRRCQNCGSELSETTKICSQCGAQGSIDQHDVDVAPSETAKNIKNSRVSQTNKTTSKSKQDKNQEKVDNQTNLKPTKTTPHSNYSETTRSISGGGKTLSSREKAVNVWNGLDKFSKLIAICGAVVALLSLGAFLKGDSRRIGVSIVQIGLLGCAFLLHKGIIKAKKDWIKYLLLGGAAVLILASFSRYSSHNSTANNSSSNSYRSNQGAASVITTVTEVAEHELYIDIKSEANLFLSTYDMEIILDQDELGVVSNGETFTKLIVVTEGKHDLVIYKSGDHSIKANRSITIAGPTTIRAIIAHDSSSISFENTSIIDAIDGARIEMTDTVGVVLSEAEQKLKDAGFINIHHEGTDSIFDTDNWIVVRQNIPAGTVSDKNDEIKLECIKLDQYYNDLLSGKTLLEAERIADEEKFSLHYRNANTYKDISDSVVSLSDEEKRSWTVEKAQQSEKGYAAIYLLFNGTAKGDEAIVPLTYYECNGNYKDIFEKFKNAGFTNVSTEIDYDIIWGITEEESVDTVTINGEDTFYKGDIYKKDAKIVITYHMKSEDNPSNQQSTSTSESKHSVYYSTNDGETAKNGNSGVFAYRRSGSNYDLYWIIDFDNGYAYYFLDGNGDSTCDRVKIESGDLNEYVLITYHDGGDTWQEALCFKWKRQPEHVLFQDSSGYAYDYYATNLDDAIRIRDTKTIKDY